MEICFKCNVGIGNYLKSPIEGLCKYCYVPEPLDKYRQELYGMDSIRNVSVLTDGYMGKVLDTLGV